MQFTESKSEHSRRDVAIVISCVGFVPMSQPPPSRRIDESNRDIAPVQFGVSIVDHRRGIA
jgi:hypothetical protein